MKFQYCPLCGTRLVKKYSWDEGNVPYCETHNRYFFDTPIPCVLVALVKEQSILLLKQEYIFRNSRTLIAGYITSGETAEETVLREVKEETGIEAHNIRYMGTEYVTKGELLMLMFKAEYKSGEIDKSTEVGDAQWFDINEACEEMQEDVVGKKLVCKLLEEMNSTLQSNK